MIIYKQIMFDRLLFFVALYIIIWTYIISYAQLSILLFNVLKERIFNMKNSKSIVFKRQQTILKMLENNKTIDVDNAATELNVSSTTIRRDLSMFEKQHLITRFHGGAQLIEGTLKEEDLHNGCSAINIDSAQKHTIAKYAADLIEEGDTIFINSSSTTLLLLDYIKNKRVVIVTNNGNVIGYPKDNNVEIILTGGEVYNRKQSMVGEFALHTLTKIIADKAFIGVGGISVDGGITTSVLPETAINEMMMKRCHGSCYVLAATKKIGYNHNFLSGSIDNVNTIITCQGANTEELDKLRKYGINVIELKQDNNS